MLAPVLVSMLASQQAAEWGKGLALQRAAEWGKGLASQRAAEWGKGLASEWAARLVQMCRLLGQDQSTGHNSHGKYSGKNPRMMYHLENQDYCGRFSSSFGIKMLLFNYTLYLYKSR
jgi:hypothetical protein